MLNSLLKYGSVAAKVRAMYGKMLTEQDWRRLCGMAGLPEIAAFLQAHEGWANAGTYFSASCGDAPKLISAVRSQLQNERARLYKYATREDKQYLNYAVYEEEYKLILQCLRRFRTVRGERKALTVSGFLKSKTSIDLDALETAENFSDIKKAVQGCRYDAALDLLTVPAGSQFPDYAAASVILEHKFYTDLYSFLMRRYKGSGKDQLTERAGTICDMQNILHILRLQRHFPGALPEAKSMLIPVSLKLTPDLVKSLISARSESEAVAVLKQSRWKDTFNNYDPGNLEKMFEDGMRRLNRKLLRSPEPSLCVPQAYLDLKEDEANKLIRVIEAVRYGIPPASVI